MFMNWLLTNSEAMRTLFHRCSIKKDENKAEIHKTQIISYKINKQTHKSGKVVYKIKYTS